MLKVDYWLNIALARVWRGLHNKVNDAECGLFRSGSNTVRLSTKNQTALCRSGLQRPNVAQLNLLLSASLVAASRSYKNQDSPIKRSVLGLDPRLRGEHETQRAALTSPQP